MGRGFRSGSQPLLFDALDAPDGLIVDAGIAFLLATNRADLLEPAPHLTHGGEPRPPRVASAGR